MDIKELKEFEVKLNQKLKGKSVDGNLLEELLADMKAMEADGQTILVAFHKAEDGNIRAFARVRTHTDIEGMSKTELEARLVQLEEVLEGLEIEEPDDSYKKEYEEWEERIVELEDEIDEVKEKLEEFKESKLNIALTGVSCLKEEYLEFVKTAKPVFIDGEQDNILVEFLAQNENVKKSILDICNLILATNSVSISLIQRKLMIGYNKAGIIIDMLEELDAITPFDGMCARKVKAEQLLKIRSYVE